MDKLFFFLKIFLFTFVIGIAAAIIFFSAPLRNTVVGFFNTEVKSVKGASTKRAQDISQQIITDIGSGADIVKKQVLNMKVSEVLNSFNRLQKIPQDIKVVQKYIQDQIGNFLSKRK